MVTTATKARQHKNHSRKQITWNQKPNTMFQPTIGTSESSEDEDEYVEEVEEDEEDDEEIEYEEEDEEEEEEEDENENEIEEEDEDDDENQDYEYDEENENAEEEEIEEEDEEEEEPDEEEDEEDEWQDEEEDEEDQRQDEEEEEDEEEDENNEEQEEEDEDTVMARIIQRIETLPESEIGICKSDNEAFLHVMRKTNAIRKKCNPDKYVKLKQEMSLYGIPRNMPIYNAYPQTIPRKADRRVSLLRLGLGYHKKYSL
jgi:hypothetical protein